MLAFQVLFHRASGIFILSLSPSPSPCTLASHCWLDRVPPRRWPCTPKEMTVYPTRSWPCPIILRAVCIIETLYSQQLMFAYLFLLIFSGVEHWAWGKLGDLMVIICACDKHVTLQARRPIRGGSACSMPPHSVYPPPPPPPPLPNVRLLTNAQLPQIMWHITWPFCYTVPRIHQRKGDQYSCALSSHVWGTPRQSKEAVHHLE